MSNATVGIKSYTESQTLLQYDPKIEVNEDDPSYQPPQKRQLPAIESNPSVAETLNAMFPPREFEENGKKYIQYVSQ